MSTTITIRNVPEEVRDELAARAARAGKSLQEHLRGELIELARKPSADSLLERIRSRKKATGTRLPAERILKHRGREPSLSIVVDASLVVAALIDTGTTARSPRRRWLQVHSSRGTSCQSR